jgi:hypothetical protein
MVATNCSTSLIEVEDAAWVTAEVALKTSETVAEALEPTWVTATVAVAVAPLKSERNRVSSDIGYPQEEEAPLSEGASA